MTFVTFLALGISALIAVPYFAHRLRRKQAEAHVFAPVRLVPKATPNARTRAHLDERALFAIRALQVIALALLGASPLVTCSSLSLDRSGASVAIAIVLDDSMSMRVIDNANGAKRTRFARARQGARELLATLHEGDAVALVLAGRPARVLLAATTDLAAARSELDTLAESDRSTDLDGALSLARSLMSSLPQVDRRVVVLSDLADGTAATSADAAAFGASADIPVWVPMPELRTPASDCGILAADRHADRIQVQVACSSGSAAVSREVVIFDGKTEIARGALTETVRFDVRLTLPPASSKNAPNAVPELRAQLTGTDAIASDDSAPVVVESSAFASAAIGIIDNGDRANLDVATTTRNASVPVVEQALAALHVEMPLRPLPRVPDRREELASFAALVVDDPAGFTPEQRRALSAFVESGGIVLVGLGRRAASAQLGANFEPFLTHAITWDKHADAAKTEATTIDSSAGAVFFGEAAASFTDLAPRGRANLASEDTAAFEVLVPWRDGGLFIGRRVRGRGEWWLTTLPFAVEVSDFPLRPGFLALLDKFVATAKERAVPERTEVGKPWVFQDARSVEVEGPSQLGAAEVTRAPGSRTVVPTQIGAYRIVRDGTREVRVAAPDAGEIDLRPRALALSTNAVAQGKRTASKVDASWAVALGLLGLLAVELAVRAQRERARRQRAHLQPHLEH